MLNCTDLACVFHHDHFYAHLHQLRHHLQDDVYDADLKDGIDLDNIDNTKANVNDTNSDLSSLSHLDDPNDVIYMICGVVIAMLLVGAIIVLVAITINKLRKREESSETSPTAIMETQHSNFVNHQTMRSYTSVSNAYNSQQADSQIFATTSLIECAGVTNNNNNNNRNNNRTTDHEQITFARTSGVGVTNDGTPTNGWVFPPKAPQPNIYNCINNDMLLAATSDKNGFKGFRKQFSGRFKRLVTAKKPEPTQVIPPELKPQLKTIYVY